MDAIVGSSVRFKSNLVHKNNPYYFYGPNTRASEKCDKRLNYLTVL